jgi:HEAT repeat protein
VLKDEGSADSQPTNYKYPRASAAIALGMMGAIASVAVPTLAGMLTEKGGWEIQRAANCYALGRIGPVASNALPALKQALQDPSPIVRTHAARAIQLMVPLPERSAKDPASPQANEVPALLRALSDSPRRVNPKVAAGLRVLGEFAGAARPVAKKGSRKAAPPVHESIALAIGYLDSLPEPPSTEVMTAYAPNEKAGRLDADIRQYVMALGGVQQGIAPALLEALARGEQDQRVLAIRRLAPLGPQAKEAIPVLTGRLQDDDWLVRREAFLALNQIEPD